MHNFIFNITGGLALFIYGISIMGDGLQNVAGDKVKAILKTTTSKPLIGVFIGTVLTSIIQSSSATSVLVIGFVNAGLMAFSQALAIIFGANIGTTITTQIIAFNLTHYALPILAIGFFIYFLCKHRVLKNFGYFLLGFGILFLGLSIMTSTLKSFATNPILRTIFIKYSNNYFLAILAGTIITAILQSSSTTTGIIVTLATLDLINLKGALPLILGCNIGTCITALIASIGTNLNAKRTAISHILFNLLSTLIFLPFLKPFQNLISLTSSNIARQCANAHTIFNVIGTLVFLPFIDLYAKFIIRLMPGKVKETDCLETKYLEPHLLNTPSIAIDAATKEAIRMLVLTKKMLQLIIQSFNTRNLNYIKTIDQKEQIVDARRYAITNYLISLMEQQINHQESIKIPKLMHIVSDIERIGDHMVNLKELAEQLIESKLDFSPATLTELNKMETYIRKMLNYAIKALSNKKTHKISKINTIKTIYNIEESINKLRDLYKNNHIERLTKRKCNVQAGIIFIDIIANYEKIGDHITNIGQAVV